MARKAQTTEKPKRKYTKRVKTEAQAPVYKTPYNWRKHLKPKYDGPENQPEYLRAEAAIQKDLIFAELDKWIALTPNALGNLKAQTGEITNEDVMYHLNLISRILKNKYEEKVVIM
jgi:hypothetical protein